MLKFVIVKSVGAYDDDSEYFFMGTIGWRNGSKDTSVYNENLSIETPEL